MPSAIIESVNSPEDLRACAMLMAASEPWLTLQRDFAHSLKLLESLGRDVYVARVGASLAGLVAVNMQGPFAGYIQAVVIALEWRGQTIGKQLMEYAEGRIFRDSPNVFLCVSDFNPRAQEFYRRLGYERVGELKNYVIPGASEILMRKTIASKSEFVAS